MSDFFPLGGDATSTAFQWTVDPSLDSYELVIANWNTSLGVFTGDTTLTYGVSGLVTPVTVSGNTTPYYDFLPQSEYKVYLVAKRDLQPDQTSSIYYVITSMNAPNISNVTSNQIDFQWDAPINVQSSPSSVSYTVSRYDSVNPTVTQRVYDTISSFTGLLPGTNYTISVQVNDENLTNPGGTAVLSWQGLEAVQQTSVETPVPTISDINFTGSTVNWTPLTNAGFDYTYLYTDYASSVPLTITGTDTSNFVIYDASPNTEYTVTLEVCDSNVNKNNCLLPYSTAIYTTTALPNPLDGPAFQSFSCGYSYVSVTQDLPATPFQIIYANNSTEQVSQTVYDGIASFTQDFYGDTLSIIYKNCIQTYVGDYVCSSDSPSLFLDTQTQLPRPPAPTLIAVTADSSTVSWQPQCLMTSYTAINLDASIPQETSITTDGTIATFTGLTAGTTYDVSVKSVYFNQASQKVYSSDAGSALQYTTSGGGSPESATPTIVDQRYITFGVTFPTVANYEITQLYVDNAPYAYSVTSPFIASLSVLPQTSYSVQLQSCDPTTCLALSPSVTAYTLAIPAGGNPNLVNATSNSLQINWASVSYINSTKVQVDSSVYATVTETFTDITSLQSTTNYSVSLYNCADASGTICGPQGNVQTFATTGAEVPAENTVSVGAIVAIAAVAAVLGFIILFLFL